MSVVGKPRSYIFVFIQILLYVLGKFYCKTIWMLLCSSIILFIPTGLSPNRAAFLTCAAVFVTIFSTLYLLLKIPTLYTVLLGMMFAIRSKRIESGVWIQWTFELTVRHILEIVLHILSIVFVLTTFRNECMCPTRGEWQAGTIAVFFAWIELLSYIQQFPPLGFYIEMLWKIVARFLKVLFIALLLLIAFSFAFYMTFYEPDILVSFFNKK